MTVQSGYKVTPLFNVWDELFNRDQRMTRNFKISTSMRTPLKLIEVRPGQQSKTKSIEKFISRTNLLREVAHIKRTPEIKSCNEIAMIVEWIHGSDLLSIDIQADDIAELAVCLATIYKRMTHVPNTATIETLNSRFENLYQDAIITDVMYRSCKKRLMGLEAPGKVLTGPAFGDVSLPNFIRNSDGKIYYIDVMGIVAAEPMLINLSKLGAMLSPAQSSKLYRELDSTFGDVLKYRDWATLARITQVIRSKMSAGKMVDKAARHQKVADSITELKDYLSGAIG